MCQKTYFAILDENPKLKESPDILKAAVHRLTEPEPIAQETDDVSRVVRYAAYYSEEEPYQVAILTTDDKKAAYESNQHYVGLKKVSVKTSLDALRLIDIFYEKCMDKDYY